MAERLTETELAEIEARHQEQRLLVDGWLLCRRCGSPWPCDARRLVAEMRAARQAREDLDKIAALRAELDAAVQREKAGWHEHVYSLWKHHIRRRALARKVAYERALRDVENLDRMGGTALSRLLCGQQWFVNRQDDRSGLEVMLTHLRHQCECPRDDASAE